MAEHGNSIVNRSRWNPQDEYFTLRSDVEAQMRHFAGEFDGAVVLLPCNDAGSAFDRWFADNGERLGVRGVRVPEGDFRGLRNAQEWAAADAVATNPPFSLFPEFFEMLFRYRVRFLVVGNLLAVTQMPIWRRLEAGEVWLGHGLAGMRFRVPDGLQKASASPRPDGDWEVRVGTACWFTNMGERPRRGVRLRRSYTPSDYPEYDNYAGVANVDRVLEIPYDYGGVLGVPLTFLTRHDPAEFDLLGVASPGLGARWRTKEYDSVVAAHDQVTGARRALNSSAVLRGDPHRNGDGLRAKFKRVLVRRRPERVGIRV